MAYTVSEVPPTGLGIILGFQHFLTMLGATALIPILLIPAMGGDVRELVKPQPSYNWSPSPHLYRLPIPRMSWAPSSSSPV